MMAGVCLFVCLSVRLFVCRMPRPNSRTEKPRKTKIGRMEAHHTGNPWTYLEVKRSKVNVTRPINASQTMRHTQVGGITMFLKLALFHPIRSQSMHVWDAYVTALYELIVDLTWLDIHHHHLFVLNKNSTFEQWIIEQNRTKRHGVLLQLP